MKAKLLLLLILAAYLLTGCANENVTLKDVEKDTYPKITILANGGADLSSADFYYVIDDKTGVVYLAFSQFRQAGITVMLNSDGSPVTYDQIKEER